MMTDSSSNKHRGDVIRMIERNKHLLGYKTLHVEHFAQVYDALGKLCEFDMAVCVSAPEGDPHQCGTAACICGTAALVVAENKYGDMREWPSFSEEDICCWLGITDIEGDRLFYAHEHPHERIAEAFGLHLDRVTLEDALHAMRNVMQYGAPMWSEVAKMKRYSMEQQDA